MQSAGKRSRQLVMDAFEMIGGVERFAEWASENPGEFYTKLFTKTITTETDVNHTHGVESVLDELEAAEAAGDVIDADYEELTGDDEGST
jgi:hypothetical protein